LNRLFCDRTRTAKRASGASRGKFAAHPRDGVSLVPWSARFDAPISLAGRRRLRRDLVTSEVALKQTKALAKAERERLG
jgi:hypothetical protein